MSTDSDLITDDDLKTEKAKKPASKWKAKFTISNGFICQCNTFHKPPYSFSCELYPSKDVADTTGMEMEELYAVLYPHIGMVFIHSVEVE